MPKTEEELKQIVKEDTNDMLQTFTFNEHMKIVFVPLVITEMAWSYADKVVQQAIDNRIPQTVKLTRTVKMLKEEYYKEIGKDLDKAHVDQIKTESKRFMEECARDLLIMRLQVNQSLKSKWYDLSYLDMRTDAYCCIVMLSLLEENEKVVKDIIREAWTGNEMPQGQSCNAKYLATNQNASVALEVDEEVVAGINGMCQQETQEDAFYRMYIDED